VSALTGVIETPHPLGELCEWARWHAARAAKSRACRNQARMASDRTFCALARRLRLEAPSRARLPANPRLRRRRRAHSRKSSRSSLGARARVAARSWMRAVRVRVLRSTRPRDPVVDLGPDRDAQLCGRASPAVWRVPASYLPERDLIGIGAAVARRPLPHHRAYGSVHGGSRWLRRHFLEQ
jgi:hypothetical protein